MLRLVKSKIGPLLLFILIFAVSRIPGMLPQNFSAAYALMFCAGVYLVGRSAWWVPLGAMVVTDLALNIYYWQNGVAGIWEPRVLGYQLINYVAYVAIILFGRRFKPQSSFLSLLGGGVLGALLFYFITNTASWLFNPFQNPEYTKTFFGWLTALIKGTHGWPETWQFFRNTLLSGGLFTGLFVGAMKLSEAAESAEEKKEPAREEESEAGGKPEPEGGKA
jgi:hypothetical protein